jgi:Rv2525c-like, glycoside hydrolase-like domain
MMKRQAARIVVFLTALLSAHVSFAQQSYAGFDRNNYPGDALLPALRKDFRYTSFWLNNPPGETTNSWTGKRPLLRRCGFGFLVLFNGRTDAQLKGRNTAALGTADGNAAVAAATREGFPRNVLIFLDQEEGGRLLPEQSAYLFAWIDAVRAGGARAGVYCSGIKVPDGNGTISTAEYIAAVQAQRVKTSPGAQGRPDQIPIWIALDQCPPSPGCTLSHPGAIALDPSEPVRIAAWQYALSPRRAQFSAECPRNAAPDGNCYAPGLPHNADTFVDLDTSDSPNPSEAP